MLSVESTTSHGSSPEYESVSSEHGRHKKVIEHTTEIHPITVAESPTGDGRPGSAASNPVPAETTPAASGTGPVEAGPALPASVAPAAAMPGPAKRSKVNLARQQAANASMTDQ